MFLDSVDLEEPKTTVCRLPDPLAFFIPKISGVNSDVYLGLSLLVLQEFKMATVSGIETGFRDISKSFWSTEMCDICFNPLKTSGN